MAEERRLSSERVFDGKLLQLRVDTVVGADGEQHKREVVEHPGAVAVLPVLADGRLVLVRQYRYAIGQDVLEVPAGTREPGEPGAETARRELREETGYRAARLSRMLHFYSSPGWSTEELDVYVAEDLSEGEAAPDSGEDLSLELIAPGEIGQLVASGCIIDGKTLVALLAWTGTRIPAR